MVCASQRNKRFGNGEAFFASQLFCLLFFLFSVGVYCLGFLVERGHFLGKKTKTKKKKKKKKKKTWEWNYWNTKQEQKTNSSLPLH